MTCAHCDNKATRQRYILEAAGLILKWLCEECIEADEKKCAEKYEANYRKTKETLC